MNEPDFYIGYLPRAPRSLSMFVKRAVLGAALAALVVAVVLVLTQAPFAPSRFEYGHTRMVEGNIAFLPYPALLTSASSYLLVAPGKYGITDQFAGFQGRHVRLQGSLIELDGDRMLEVLPDGLDVQTESNPVTADTALGSVVLTGEIVDTKCHFGVMNPGNGKVHRDCAVRCISGGIPPGLLVRDRGGNVRTVLLAGRDGRELHKEILDFVGEPVQVRGTLHRRAGFLVLDADVSAITSQSGRE